MSRTVAELDQELARLGPQVRVLSVLNWGPSQEERFLRAWRSGSPELPTAPEHPPPADIDDELEAVRREADLGDPRGRFIARTAENLVATQAMLRAVGTPSFTRIGLELFDAPTSRIAAGAPSWLEQADAFIHAADTVLPVELEEMEEPAYRDEEAARWVKEAVAPYFDDLPVELDPDLASFASASSKRIRLRAGYPFTETQLAQLVEHEALVHTATKRNGKAQEQLTCLGISTARTTSTQEGLATLAELITDTMDLTRLRRLALRVKALHLGLEGADFIEVFTFFLEAGQPTEEAYASTMRLFRGGDVRGRVLFPKDGTYLPGLTRVHTFLLAATREGRSDLIRMLFAGRLTEGDAVDLAPLLADGTLSPPITVPRWAARHTRLAAYLTFSLFGARLPVARIGLGDFA